MNLFLVDIKTNTTAKRGFYGSSDGALNIGCVSCLATVKEKKIHVLEEPRAQISYQYCLQTNIEGCAKKKQLPRMERRRISRARRPEGSNLERRVGNSDVGDPTNRTPEEGEREERKSGGGKEMDGKANTILI